MQVLFVEDNGADAELLVEAFDEVSDRVDCVIASTPAAALHQVGQHRWDLLLMDLRLGPHDGHLLLETLARDGIMGKFPVYVLSSSAAPDDVERANRLPIHGYLRKPFTIDGWIDLARELVPPADRSGSVVDEG